eukprot:2766251-Pyramimonas_sp.AAC.1
MRLPCPGQPLAAHRDLRRLRYSQRRYSQLHMAGSFARLIFAPGHGLPGGSRSGRPGLSGPPRGSVAFLWLPPEP